MTFIWERITWTSAKVVLVSLSKVTGAVIQDIAEGSGNETSCESVVSPIEGKELSKMESETKVTNGQVYASMISLAVVGFPALIMMILSLQLMLHLEYYNRGASEEVSQRHGILLDVALSLCTVTLTFSIAAMFVAFLQLFLCLKAVKLAPDFQIRTLKFLRQGMLLRFIGFIGFFLSIPVFLLSVMVSVHVLEVYGSYVSAAAFTVTGAVGLIICAATIGHAVYSWFMGHLCLAMGSHKNKESGKTENLLSTLV